MGERISVSCLYTFLSLSHVAGTGHYHLGPLPTSTRETCLALTYSNTRRNAIDNSRRAETKHACKIRTNIISIQKDERQLISVVTPRLERYTTMTARRGLARTPSQTCLTTMMRLLPPAHDYRLLCAFTLYFHHSSLLCHPLSWTILAFSFLLARCCALTVMKNLVEV